MLKELGPAAIDVQVVPRFVEHECGWSSRSLALFSCAPAAFFRACGLMVPLRSRARFVDSSYLKPLLDLLDTYGESGVAVVEHAVRRVLVEGGEIDFLSPKPGKGSSAGSARSSDTKTRRSDPRRVPEVSPQRPKGYPPDSAFSIVSSPFASTSRSLRAANGSLSSSLTASASRSRRICTSACCEPAIACSSTAS